MPLVRTGTCRQSTDPGRRFDDIVYDGADADRIETLGDLLGTGGILDIALGGESIGRPVAIDVGRVHYDEPALERGRRGFDRRGWLRAHARR